jgi:OOP family OmpA-OmpF porin
MTGGKLTNRSFEMNKSVLLAFLLVLAGLSSPALASGGSHWFVRGEAGSTNLEIDGADGDDDTFGVRGGFFFNQYVAVEAFYANYGDDSSAGDSVKISGVGLGAVGKKSFGLDPHTGFFISGRIGAVRNETKVRIGGLGSAKDDSIKAYAGVGAGYDFNRNFGLGLNYDYTEAEAFGLEAKLKTATFGIEYRF